MDAAVTAAIELLSHRLSAKRRSGAKRLLKLAARDAGPALLAALEAEVKDPRTWESQHLLIVALGVCRHTQALPFLRQMSEQKHRATVLYMALGDAIFRLLLELNGVDRAIETICKTDNFKMMYGAFHAIAILRLVPNDETIRLMIARAKDPRAATQVVGHPGDTTGVRKWVAAAAASWRPELVDSFLRECRAFNDDRHLQLAAESSLKREHVNWGSPY
jgi:hypothetical protein